MSDRLYKAIRIEDYNGEPVQFAGVYVTKWNNATMGEPTILFVEADDDSGESNDIHTKTG